MSFQSQCNSCSQKYLVPDHALGNAIRCPFCKKITAVAVPSSGTTNNEIPSSPTEGWSDGQQLASKASSPMKLLAGGILAVLLVVGVVATGLALSSRNEPAEKQIVQENANSEGTNDSEGKNLSTGKNAGPEVEENDLFQIQQIDAPAPNSEDAKFRLRVPKLKNPPQFIVRFHSVQRTVQNMQILADASGKSKELAGVLFLAQQLGQDFFTGINSRKPLGAYLHVNPDLQKSKLVMLVPVSNEAIFLAFLGSVNLQAQRGQDGIYTVRQFRIPERIAFRFAHGYAHFTIKNMDAIHPKNLINPEKIFSKTDESDFSTVVFLERIPESLRKQAIDLFRTGSENFKKQLPPAKTESEKVYDEKMWEIMVNLPVKLFEGGKELSLEMSLKPQEKMVETNLLLNGRKNSQLAADIASMGQIPSLFADLVQDNESTSGLVHLKMPEELLKSFQPVVAELRTKSLKKAKPEDREITEKLFDSLEPTLKAGELDLAGVFQTNADGKTASLVGGLKLVDAQKLENVLREIHKSLPPEDQKRLHFDVAKVNGASIHKLTIHDVLNEDDPLRKALGEQPLFLAFQKNALLFAGGAEARQLLEKALRLPPRKAPLFHWQTNLKQTVTFMGTTDLEKELADKIFTNQNPGRFLLTLEGGPALRLHNTFDLAILQYLSVLNQRQGKLLGIFEE